LSEQHQVPDDGQELAEKAAAGDSGALKTLLERYLPELRAFVRLRAGPEVRSHESRSDIVQSVCREVLEHAERFRHPSQEAFKRWLYATVLRKVQNRQRFWTAERRDAGRVIQPMQKTDDSEAGLLECYRTFTTPSQFAIASEEVERIEAAFDQMPAEYRQVITLAHIVGMSRAEIGEEMGKSEGAVRVLLHRALVRASEILDPGESE